MAAGHVIKYALYEYFFHNLSSQKHKARILTLGIGEGRSRLTLLLVALTPVTSGIATLLEEMLVIPKTFLLDTLMPGSRKGMGVKIHRTFLSGRKTLLV